MCVCRCVVSFRFEADAEKVTTVCHRNSHGAIVADLAPAPRYKEEHTMSNTDCVECRNRLVPSGSYTFRGAELGCRECHLLYAVALGPEGISLTFVGGPCAYCGTHTADG